MRENYTFYPGSLYAGKCLQGNAEHGWCALDNMCNNCKCNIYIRIHKLNKAAGCSEPQGFFSLSCVALGLLNQSEFVVAISLSCFGSRVSLLMVFWCPVYCLAIEVSALPFHFLFRVHVLRGGACS